MAWSKRVQEKADFNLDKPIIKRLSMWDVECNFDPDVRSNTFTICVQMQVLFQELRCTCCLSGRMQILADVDIAKCEVSGPDEEE